MKVLTALSAAACLLTPISCEEANATSEGQTIPDSGFTYCKGHPQNSGIKVDHLSMVGDLAPFPKVTAKVKTTHDRERALRFRISGQGAHPFPEGSLIVAKIPKMKEKFSQGLCTHDGSSFTNCSTGLLDTRFNNPFDYHKTGKHEVEVVIKIVAPMTKKKRQEEEDEKSEEQQVEDEEAKLMNKLEEALEEAKKQGKDAVKEVKKQIKEAKKKQKQEEKAIKEAIKKAKKKDNELKKQEKKLEKEAKKHGGEMVVRGVKGVVLRDVQDVQDVEGQKMETLMCIKGMVATGE